MEICHARLDYTKPESSADGSVIHNPSCRSVWIGDKNGNVYELAPGQTVTFPENR